jgi:outer membrane lipoprotein-sorting protein
MLINYRGYWLAIAATILLNSNVFAETESPEAKGLAIAKEMKARDTGWTDSTATMEMQLFSRGDMLATREMRIKSLEKQDDGDKSLTIFDTPRDVQGTAFLSFTHILEPDDQWLYLPALKRVKQISSKNKTSPFMGSEFSYEDLNSFEVARYDYKWLRNETFNDMECYVIEAYPKDPYSGYSKEVVWVDHAELRPLKADYYDKRGKLLKTLIYSDYQQYLDTFWRPATQTMVNHQNNKKTIVLMKNYQFKTGLDESDFTRNSLQRAR